MKRNTFYTLFGIFLLASCQQEDLGKGEGLLSISELETKPIIEASISSRAVDETLTIELWKGGVKLRVLTPEEMSGKINLDVASDYSLKVYSSNYGSDSNWTDETKGEPIYYIEVPFEIKEGEVTGLNVKVPMINFGVSLDLSSIVGLSWLKEYSFTVTSGERTVSLQSGETAYFAFTEGMNFSYNLSVTNIDDETNHLNNIWGDSEEEKVNNNTIYTIYYDLATNTLNQK